MPRDHIIRKTVDVTEAQAAALQAMISQAEQKASQAGVREFFHLLLRRHAQEAGLEWPDDYPLPGGYRGGPKDDRGSDV
jgi:hypothetical protein